MDEAQTNATRPLGCVLRLAAEWDARGVRYCHFKSNAGLDAALAGATDLDVLADRAQAEAVRAGLAAAGFKRFASVGVCAYPSVEDHLACDAETTMLVHVHLHFRLLVGERHLKSFMLPWDGALLARRVRDPRGLWTTTPADEALLLLVRASMKFGGPAGALALRGGEAAHMTSELRWLAARVAPEALAQACDTLLPEARAAVAGLLGAGRLQAGALREVRRAVFRRYGAFRRGGALARWRELLARRSAWVSSVLVRRGAPWYGPFRRTPAAGGVLIAIVGADGSGKSTAARDVARWLEQKADVGRAYFGSGDGVSSWWVNFARALRGLVRGRRTAGRNRGLGADAEGWRAKVVRLCWGLALALDKRRKLQRALRMRAAGLVVVAERYPQCVEPGIMDGRLLECWDDAPSWPLRAAARYEAEIYALSERLEPDLVLRLDVAPAVALARKPDELDLEVATLRVAIATKLRFPAARREATIDADAPPEAVTRAVRNAVWSAL